MRRFCRALRDARSDLVHQREGRGARRATSARRRQRTRRGPCFFLAGRRLLRLLPTRLLREWTVEVTGLAPWLLDESYGAVGDLAETLALLLDGVPADGDERGVRLHTWIEDRLEGLRAKAPEAQRDDVVRWWRGLPSFERFLLNKLLTGEMRVGVSQTLVVRALAGVAGVGTDVMTHRLMGQWTPSAGGLPGADGP